MIYFSVVIPLYNKAENIANTLRSVLAQTFTNYEVIVVNDGSTDNSLEIVEAIKSERIKLFSISNGGAAIARNYGVQKASGNYIAFIDGDDLWYPFHLENLSNIINEFPEAKWMGTAYEILHNNRLKLKMDAPPMLLGENWIGPVNDYFINSLRDSLAWTSAICFKTTFFNELKGFNPAFQTGQDTDLWIRAALASDFYFSNRISAQYNLLGVNRLTNVPTNKKAHMNLNQFIDKENTDASLKKYLDLVRYSHVIKFKLSNSPIDWKPILNQIDINNLTPTQRFLITKDRHFLKFLWLSKELSKKFGIRIRTSKNHNKERNNTSH